MRLLGQPIDYELLPGAMPAWQRQASADELIAFSHAVRHGGGRLVSLWGSDERDLGAGFALHAAFAIPDGLALLHVPLTAESPTYPDLSAMFPNANRLQRAAHDLLGLRADTGYGAATDTRPWLRHDAWPADFYPLRRDCTRPEQAQPEDYAFFAVEGDDIHEMPVGPILAGISEPAQFRFTTVGESVLHMEERLGYAHKGIDLRFTQLDVHQGIRLAGRVAGDSTVAYAWAYAMALEAIAGVVPPARALWLRAIMLESERVGNHIGDLGGLAGDAGFTFGKAQFMRLREEWLRLNAQAFGHRYCMDRITPGGVCCNIDDDMRLRLHAQCNAIEHQVKILREICDESSGLQDRFLTTGRVAPEVAQKLGLVGPAGRASNQAWDLRVRHPTPPYDEIDFEMSMHGNGDVAARVTIRFDEILESLRIIRRLADHLTAGETRLPVSAPPAGGFGIGWVEGWRGEVFVALTAGPAGTIRNCHCCDPSWHNWPAVEHAAAGSVVPDFPLISRSFSLSSSAQDL
jgi:Ni,Fe-hydrogenase III large subunit/Ni,Fe-hydrogenase III component G